jgi:hypothetical protein
MRFSTRDHRGDSIAAYCAPLFAIVSSMVASAIEGAAPKKPAHPLHDISNDCEHTDNQTADDESDDQLAFIAF